jgi:DNA polymerase-3 subunit beta
MKLECIYEKIYNALQHTEKVVGKNLSLPVLGKILMLANDSSVILRSTNLRVGVEVTIPAKVEDQGVVAVDGDVFVNILSHNKNEKNILLEKKEGNIKITTEKTSTILKGYHPEDFPNLPRIENGITFSIPIEDIMKGFKSVFYAASLSEIKPEIASIYMYPDGGELVFVATDSFRLAEKKVKVKNLPEFEGILIPIKNIQDIIKVYTSDKGSVEIKIGENQISFSTESVYLTSQIIDGIFPDYRQILPKEFATEVTALTSDVLQAVRMTNVFADRFNQVDVVVNVENKKVTFASHNADIGENTTAIDAVIKGQSITASINHRYISDVFQSISQDSIKIGFIAENKPLIIENVGDASFVYLIMPMNR